MQVNINALRKSITEKGMTQESVAKAIGVDASTFTRKMKSEGLSFSIGQMHKIVDVLSISKEQATDIFLSENSQKCENLCYK